MRASLLFLALTTLVVAPLAADAQTRPKYSGAARFRAPAASPRIRDRGEPIRVSPRPRPSARPGSPGIDARYPGGRRPAHRHGWHPWGGWWRPMPWWYWYYRYPYYWPGHHRPNWQHGGHRSRMAVRQISYGMEDSYRGSDCGKQSRPPVMCPPVSNPDPYGTDAYAADPSAYGTDPYATDPSAYEDVPYTEDLEGPYVYSPYYEADPVQFSYTPADIPQRAAVVRPDRTSLVSLILPKQARMPLYELVTLSRPPDETMNPLAATE
jgi:hypothetical protein